MRRGYSTRYPATHAARTSSPRATEHAQQPADPVYAARPLPRPRDAETRRDIAHPLPGRPAGRGHRERQRATPLRDDARARVET